MTASHAAFVSLFVCRHDCPRHLAALDNPLPTLCPAYSPNLLSFQSLGDLCPALASLSLSTINTATTFPHLSSLPTPQICGKASRSSPQPSTIDAVADSTPHSSSTAPLPLPPSQASPSASAVTGSSGATLSDTSYPQSLHYTAPTPTPTTDETASVPPTTAPSRRRRSTRSARVNTGRPTRQVLGRRRRSTADDNEDEEEEDDSNVAESGHAQTQAHGHEDEHEATQDQGAADQRHSQQHLRHLRHSRHSRDVENAQYQVDDANSNAENTDPGQIPIARNQAATATGSHNNNSSSSSSIGRRRLSVPRSKRARTDSSQLANSGQVHILPPFTLIYSIQWLLTFSPKSRWLLHIFQAP